MIVQVVKRNEDGFKLTNGKEEFTLAGVSSYANEGSIAKLRSVARIDTVGKSKSIVPNNFTSLINIREDSQDARLFHKNFTAMEIEEDIFTPLAQLASMPLSIFVFIKVSAKIKSIMSKWKLPVYLLTNFLRLLNFMMKREMLAVMPRKKILFQFTNSISSAMMTVPRISSLRFGSFPSMAREEILLTE